VAFSALVVAAKEGLEATRPKRPRAGRAGSRT